MATRRNRMIAATGLALAIPVVLAWFGLFRNPGAHPFRDVQTALIGALAGCALGLAAIRVGRHGADSGLASGNGQPLGWPETGEQLC